MAIIRTSILILAFILSNCAFGSSVDSSFKIGTKSNLMKSSLNPDSTKVQLLTLIDSLKRPQVLRPYFFRYESIKGELKVVQKSEITRDLPKLKAIHLRKIQDNKWKFWILFLSVLFLALVRLINVRQFNEILAAAFDMDADYRKFSLKSGTYFSSNLGLFLNFVFALAVFVYTFLENIYLYNTGQNSYFFWELILIILATYSLKIVIQVAIGRLFKMRKLSSIVLFNSVLINHTLGVFLVVLNLFLVFVTNQEYLRIIAGLGITAILIGITYRQLKNLFMATHLAKLPIIYIFLYLCALEILPWLVLFKLFLNSW